MTGAAKPLLERTPDAELVRIRELVGEVEDPELPPLTLADLGILRDVVRDGDGRAVVRLTPTYSGCPAALAIRLEVETRLAAAGHGAARVETALTPPWSSDDITEQGRRKLLAAGIAPPAHRMTSPRALFAPETVACPRCGSAATERLSEFGSTVCKALWRCTRCREPFDYFKCL